MRWARHIARVGEMRNVYTILIGRPEGMTPLRRLKCILRIILKWIVKK
jgi:hypothetical protein